MLVWSRTERRSASGMWMVVVRWSISHSTRISCTAAKIGFRVIDGELVVERDVGADEFRDVAHRGDIGVERLLQPLDVLVGRDLRGLPGDARLEEKPRLLHLALALRRWRPCA